jgi:hypothetical protein
MHEMIRDDRGRRCKVLDDLRYRRPTDRRIHLLLALLGIPLGLAIRQHSAPGYVNIALTAIATMPLLAVAAMPVALIVVLRRKRERVSQLSKTQACLACGYSLKDLPSDPDGCTICPECGAAWRLEREEDSSLGGVLERLP